MRKLLQQLFPFSKCFKNVLVLSFIKDRVSYFCSKALVFFLLTVLFTSVAQAQELQFKIYTSSQIASGSTPKSIVQDSLGFILILTDKGLFRFNGLEFSPVRHAPSFTQLVQTHTGKLLGLGLHGVYEVLSLPDTIKFHNRLSSQQPIGFFEDSKAGWWIQLISGDILHYTSGRSVLFSVPSHTQPLFLWNNSQKGISALSQDGKLFEIQSDQPTFQQIDELPQLKGLVSLIQRSDYSFWAATNHDLYEMQLLTSGKQKVKLTKMDLPTSEITSLFQDHYNHLYVGTNNRGLLRTNLSETSYHFEETLFSNQITLFDTLPFQSVKRFYQGKASSIWIVSKEGVTLLFPKFFYHPYPAILPYELGSISQIQNGNYYVSSINELLRLPISAHFQNPISVMRLPRGSISTTASDRNRIWIGSSLGQLSYLENDYWYPGLNLSNRGGPIFNIYTDSRHRTWFCQVYTHSPLPGITYTDSTLSIHYYGKEKGLISRIISVKESSSKNIYVGGIGENSYLYKYNPDKDYFENLSKRLPFDINHFEVHDLIIDEKENVWMASTHGLLKYDPIKKHVTRIELGPYITTAEMRAIVQDDQKQIWISTDAYGLLCFRNGTFVRYTLNNGIPPPSNVLWYRRLFIDNQKRLWVGSNTSYTASFLPAPKPLITPKPLFLELHFNNRVFKTIPFESVFPYHTNFKAAFISMSYPTGSIEYRFRLRNLEKKWSTPSTQHTISYQMLPAGDYTLEVRARKGGYDWSPPLSFSFHIEEVWYKQTWAYGIYFTILIALIWILIQVNTWRHERERLRLNKIIDSKTQDIWNKHQEILAQNEELHSQQEEIAMQRDKLSAQFEELMKAQQIIEEQNKTIRQRNKSLKKEVDIRTQELVDYNQQLEQFAFITAHNLRSPVARIQGLGTLLELAETQTDIDPKDVTKKLIKTAYDLDQVIKDLNAILEVKKNSTKILSEVNLYHELEKVKANLSKEIQDTETELQVDFSEVFLFLSIPAYIDSILHNLISNAIKYRHPDRTPIIRIRTWQQEQTIGMEVSDNGLGIDLMAYGKNVYQLYKRFHFHVEGKGLGLYLVKTQVDALGGRIELESEVNKGTTFRIYLTPGKESGI
ncbi:two-component regulator propeller domain-containing protein [Cytophagaceae bacterium BD1B2-1]|uniref:histidine kinase n=1 Tax=Xanthocytophaga agilis TaxID=3048010 RepID=A0AAE3R6Q8_9BACT|nr:two-component regulator propeller domain-containing protein [Xanthocytophaga agilis]